MRTHRRSNPQQTRMGSISKSGAYAKYYSHGSHAAKVEEAKDDVSLKYYGKLVRIENKQAARGSVAKIACASIICLCAITIVFARSIVYNYHLENEELAAALETEREATETIIAQSTEKIDIAYVEQVATTKLNMSKPQSYQIVYIEVPRSDYTVVHEAQLVEEKEKFRIASVTNIFENIKATGDIFKVSEKQQEGVDNGD